jgi:alanine racemase
MIATPLTWIEISKNSLIHNLKMYKQAIGNQSLGAVIKSNAYGHGILETAKICQQSGYTDWLFVATLSEALQLRKNGITLPILVIYFIDEDPAVAALENIELMIADLDSAKELNEIGNAIHKKIKVHLKIDSGMSRFGFLPNEALAIIKEIMNLQWIQITGIYSHLAQAANPDQSFNLEQQENFYTVLDALEKESIHIPYKHLSNSAGSTSLNQSRTNLTRVGLGIYGWWPSQANKELTQSKFSDFELKPVLAFKTRIAQIKKIPEGKTVGYDRTYKTTAPTTIAVLPVGYFDGYDRRLSSKGILLVRNQYAPVIGIIAMTSTIIDITHIPEAKIGDEVTLMGNYEQITPTHIANVIGSFNAREMMTRLNPLLPRIVVD